MKSMTKNQESKPLLASDESQENGKKGVRIIPNYTAETILVANHEEGNRGIERPTTHLPPQTVADLEHQNINPNQVSEDQVIITPDGVKTINRLQLLGVVMVMIAGMCFTGSNIIQKFVIPELTFWQLLATRALIQTVVIGATCLIMHYKFRPDNPKIEIFFGPSGVRLRTVTQGLLGGMLLASMFTAVKIVPLGNASAIMFCTPIFTFLMAPFMLGERFGCYRSLISLFMIVGVLLITRPSAIFGPDGVPKKLEMKHTTKSLLLLPDDTQPGQHYFRPLTSANAEDNLVKVDLNQTLAGFYWSPIPLGTSFHKTYEEHIKHHHHHFTATQTIIGYTACVAVPFLSALVSLITRQCNNKKVPIYVLMFWFGVGASCVIVGAQLILGLHGLFNVSYYEMLVMIGVTALGIYGNLSYTFAVKLVSPSYANVFRSFEVMLNYCLQLKFEHTVFHAESLGGMALLFLAVVAISFEIKLRRKFSHVWYF